MSKYPAITKTLKSDRILRLSLDISTTQEWFDGHFAETKFLPSMVMVLWAEEFIRIYYAPNISIKSVDQVQIHHPILPNSIVDLVLKVDVEDKILTFQYLDPTYPSPWLYSEGILRI